MDSSPPKNNSDNYLSLEAYTIIGQDEFMQAAEVVFGFPKEIQLGETSGLISIIVEIAKTDRAAKKMIAALIDKNPSKYWDLRSSK